MLTLSLRTVLPFALVILLMSAHNRLDGFLLERWHSNGAYEAGLYAAAYRLLDAGNMLGYLTASFMVPFLAKHLSNKPLLESTILTARTFLLLAGGVSTVFVIVFALPLQQLLYPSLPLQAAQVLQACMAVLPAYLLLHVYGSLLTAMAQLKWFIFLLLFALVMNVGLNFWLIPLYGAFGSCMAAIVSQYLCAVSCFILATRKSNMGYGFKTLALAFIIVISAFALFYWGRQNALNPFWLLLAVLVAMALLLFAYIPFLKRNFVTSL